MLARAGTASGLAAQPVGYPPAEEMVIVTGAALSNSLLSVVAPNGALTNSIAGMAKFFVGFTGFGVLLIVVGALLWRLTHGEGLARSSGRGAAIAGVLLLVVCGLPALFFGVHGL